MIDISNDKVQAYIKYWTSSVNFFDISFKDIEDLEITESYDINIINYNCKLQTAFGLYKFLILSIITEEVYNYSDDEIRNIIRFYFAEHFL